MQTAAQPRILIVDDDRAFLAATAELAGMQNFETVSAHTLHDARAAIRSRSFDLTLVDLSLPDGNGADWVAEVDLAATGQIAMISGDPYLDRAVRNIRERVLECFSKPLPVQRFCDLLTRTSRERARDSVRFPAEGRCGDLIGRSPAMCDVFERIRRVAPLDATVLITGESGTGKELVARAVHELSGRRGRLVAVNCGAVSGELLASQLFGHEVGSFTGAVRQHEGYFEQADGGTLFLDEIGEMPIALQAHLLRVLETRSITRVGARRERPVDVRVIAATHRSLVQAIRAKALREDLYYRLADFPIDVPPLRDRSSDVPVLAQTFLDRLNTQYGTARRFTDAALRALADHDWPGNVRELRNRVRRAHALAQSDVLDISMPAVQRDGDRPPTLTFAVGTSFEEMERSMLLETLKYYGGDKGRTAQALGISVKTVYNHLSRNNDGDRAQDP